MNVKKGFFTNRLYRFFTAVIITWLVFISGSVTLVLWACMPGNNVLFVLAVAAWIWIGIIMFYSQYRTVSRYLYPLEKIDRYAGQIASGKFPRLLTTAGNSAECYRELIRALNQIRDKLRYLNNHCIQLQQKKQENIREINRANGLYTRFMAMLAADIRKPVNSLRGYTSLLEKDCPPEKQQHFFAGLKRNIDETEYLLSHMTKISALAGNDDDGKNSETFETGSFIHQLLDIGREILKERNISLSARFASDLPSEISTDREWLFKILLTLMHVIRVNALPGGTAEFSCDRKEKDVIFRMRTVSGLHRNISLAELYSGYGSSADSGAIMERDLLALLFIGNQAHSMNADFSVSDFGSQGTELQLVLHDTAGRRSHRNAPSVHMTSPEKHRAGMQENSNTAPAGMLLVDSDTEMANIVPSLLPDTEVTFFAGAELLPENTDFTAFDILVLEIDQFRRSQQEKAESIIARAIKYNLPVIVILTAPDPELEKHFIAEGAAGVLSKVMDFGEFTALVYSQSGR